MKMNKDPLNHIDVLCGNSNATRELRAGIATFAQEQAKHYLRMHDPAWVDRAIQSPDWAHGLLQQCQVAVDHGIRTMESQIAPFCEELANTEAKQTGIGLDRIRLKMSKKWNSLKEVGSDAIAKHIGIMKKDSHPFTPPSIVQASKNVGAIHSSALALKEGKSSLDVGFSR